MFAKENRLIAAFLKGTRQFGRLDSVIRRKIEDTDVHGLAPHWNEFNA
jgi:hypothetical protein